MKKSKMWKSLAIIGLCSGLVLSGCGGKKADGGKDSDVETASSVDWMAMLHTASPPSNKVLDKIEEKTGTKINFTWVPDASKEEKINAALASDTLKEIVTLALIDTSTVKSALQQGQFWEVEDYLKDYPNLKKIDEERIKAAKVEGKLYGVPIQQPMARYGVLVRQDWLDKLGLDVPHTTEELMEVAKAFTGENLFGDGQKTVGVAERTEAYNVGFRYLSGVFGAPDLWEVNKKGEAVPTFMTEGFVNAMDYFRELYSKGYMNSDFAVTAKNDQKEYVANGKAGIIFSLLSDAKNLINMAPAEQVETMQWTLINDLTAPGVDRRVISDTKGGVNGLIAFPKTVVKDEAHLKRLLKFIDSLMDDEIYRLMSWGIEGETYEIRDKNVVEIIDQKAWEQDVQPLISSRPSTIGYDYVSSNPYQAEADEKIAENADYAVTNPLQGLDSPTDISEGSQLRKGIEDAFFKYVMGELDKKGWEQAVSTWQKSGGNKIIEEYTEAYKKFK